MKTSELDGNIEMIYGESMHVIRFWCQSHPTLSKKWHITVSNLGIVTCLKCNCLGAACFIS